MILYHVINYLYKYISYSYCTLYNTLYNVGYNIIMLYVTIHYTRVQISSQYINHIIHQIYIYLLHGTRVLYMRVNKAKSLVYVSQSLFLALFTFIQSFQERQLLQNPPLQHFIDCLILFFSLFAPIGRFVLVFLPSDFFSLFISISFLFLSISLSLSFNLFLFLSVYFILFYSFKLYLFSISFSVSFHLSFL